MLAGVEAGNIKSLHRMRVASRRLRELLPVLQLDRASTHKLLRRLKKVTQQLGSVRELDVLLLLLDELEASRNPAENAANQLREAITEERDRARAALAHDVPISDLKRLAAKLEDLAASIQPSAGKSRPRDEAATVWAVEARITHRAERLAAAMKAAGAVYLPDRLHAVRITVKKLRYAVELSDELAGRRTSDEVRVLRRAQDVLGRMHDLQVFMDRARRVQATLTGVETAAWDQFDALIARMEDDCRRLHAKYMRERPALTAICTHARHRPHAAAPARGARRQLAS